MKTFVIDPSNNVRAYVTDKTTQTLECQVYFSSETELAGLVQGWSGSRLVEIWNKLPGVESVRRFKDRRTAVRRIWGAAQGLEPISTKTQMFLEVLQQPSGATIEALMSLTGWQSHSIRGFISAQLSKRLGFRIKSFKREGQRVYQIISKVPTKVPTNEIRRKEKT